MLNLLLLSGKGARFKDKSKSIPKPFTFIKKNKKTMFDMSLENAEKIGKTYIVVVNNSSTFNFIKKKNIEIENLIKLRKYTNGQASSAYEALNKIDINKEIINIISCDFDYLIKIKKINFKKNQAYIWTSKSYQFTKNDPSSYGWLIKNKNKKKIIFKQISDDNNRSLITGGFTFKNLSVFNSMYKNMIRNIKPTQEDYIDLMFKFSKLNYDEIQLKNFRCYGHPNLIYNK